MKGDGLLTILILQIWSSGSRCLSGTWMGRIWSDGMLEPAVEPGLLRGLRAGARSERDLADTWCYLGRMKHVGFGESEA